MTKQYFLLGLIIILYLLNGISLIPRLSLTADEANHISFGIRMLKGDPSRPIPERDNSKMPVSALNALPRAVEQYIDPQLKKYDEGTSDIMHGRYITLAFSVLTILLVFTWSKKLYGINAGLFSAFLFSVCPNNLSNAVLVTTDAYAVFFLLATMYCLWKFCNSRSLVDFILFSVFLAASQLVKQSLFHLYVLTALILIISAIVHQWKFNFRKLAVNILLFILINWFVINLGFIFYEVGRPLGDFHFMSDLFQRVQHIFPKGLAVPVSASFIEGLDQAKYYDQLGGGLATSSFGNVNILGNSVTGGSFWYYYFVTIFFKTPITYLILLGWALYLIYKKRNGQGFIMHEFFLFAPVVYFLLYMSLLYKTQCGIRHLLFIYPVIFITSGIIIKHISNRKQMIALVASCLLLLMSIGTYFNDYYPYTNEFITNKKTAYKIVGSHNLNFSQGYYFLDDYLKNNPDVKVATGTPRTGKCVLVLDDYLDIWNTGKYKWLRKLEPVDNIAHCFLLFDVKLSDIQ